jgi:hypothetical protein
VIADAQRGDVFAGTYRRVPGEPQRWEPVAPIAIVGGSAWLPALGEGAAVSGPGLARFADLVAPGCRVLAASAWTPRARVVAQIGAQALARGERADCAALEPFYLRRSSAEERAEPGAP